VVSSGELPALMLPAVALSLPSEFWMAFDIAFTIPRQRFPRLGHLY
jgi:hypothetical protein